MKLNLLFTQLKPDRHFIKTLGFLLLVFFICSFPLFLGFVLKNLWPAEYGLVKGNKNDLEITYKEIIFFFTIAFALLIISFSVRYLQKNFLKKILIAVALFYVLVAGLMVLTDVIHYLIFANRITFSSVQTALNTNGNEAQEFLHLYLTPARAGALLVFVLAVVFIYMKRNSLVALFGTGSFFIMTLLLTIFGTVDFIQTSHSKGNGLHNVRYWDITIGEYNEYREFNRRLEAEKNNNSISKEYAGFYKQDSVPKTLVFVISESLSKRHMSLYGYARKTTPHLDTSQSIYKFSNCISQAALTIDAVPALFFNGYLSGRINLIVLLNNLGYETSWISNQSGWGKGDKTIVLLSQLCKNTTFMDGMADDAMSNTSLHYDEDVLSHFEKAINTESTASKFIVLHLMGCHFDYEKRYPADRNLFISDAPAKTSVSNQKSREILNAYDNAMLYHDSVINETIRIFNRYTSKKNAALVFLSDHGEELYDYRDHAGHGYPPNRVTSEIPYFAILSEEFKKNFPETDRTMKNNSNTPYSTANNFYTLLQLLNINSEKHKPRILTNGFFSPAYRSDGQRLVMGLDYDQMPR